jgi:hypothetical protein
VMAWLDDLRPAACGLALWIYEIKNPLPTMSARDQGKPYFVVITR